MCFNVLAELFQQTNAQTKINIEFFSVVVAKKPNQTNLNQIKIDKWKSQAVKPYSNAFEIEFNQFCFDGVSFSIFKLHF